MKTVKASLLLSVLFSGLSAAANADQIFYPIQKDNLTGFINDKGEMVVPPVFDEIDGYLPPTGRNDLITIKKNNKLGLINTKGEFVLLPMYDYDSSSFDFTEGAVASYRLDKKCGYINEKGKKVTNNIYDQCDAFQEKRAAVKLNGKWGLMDETGKMLTDFKFDRLSIVSEGLAAIKMNGKYGFINTRGDIVIKPVHTNGFAMDFSSGLARIGSRSSGKYYFIDKAGKTVLNIPYEHVYSFKKDFAVVRSEIKGVDKYGVIDKQGNLHIDLKYLDIDVDDNGRLAVVEEETASGVKQGILDLKTKKYLVQPVYDEIATPYKGLVYFKKNGKYGWKNTEFKTVIPAKFNILLGFGDGNLAKVKLGDKVGYINRKGTWISNYYLD